MKTNIVFIIFSCLVTHCLVPLETADPTLLLLCCTLKGERGGQSGTASMEFSSETPLELDFYRLPAPSSLVRILTLSPSPHYFHSLPLSSPSFSLSVKAARVTLQEQRGTFKLLRHVEKEAE